MSSPFRFLFMSSPFGFLFMSSPFRYCVHHFVSSWVVHDKTKHSTTDSARRAAGTPTGASEIPAGVPVGQALRSSNTWRSFELERCH